MTDRDRKQVLIYDESGFSRICAALLEMCGISTSIMGESSSKLNSPDVGVFITSYPYGALLIDEVRKRNIPAVVLFDDLNSQFINVRRSSENLYCMMKPLDYERFKGLVQRLLSGSPVPREDSAIL